MNKQIKKKLSFAAADIFGGGSFNIVNFLYPGFLALTVGLSAYWIGVIMLITRIWDATIDPFIGYLSDRTKSRFGKRRIYLLITAPLVLLSMYLLFFPYQFPNVNIRVVVVLVSYLLFTTVQSFVMIPYYSLASEISDDYQKRASFNSYRLAFSIFSSIICVAVPGIIIEAFKGNEGVGYQVMSLTFGTIFMISILITALFAREEIVSEPSNEKLNLKTFIKPLKIKPFRQYLYMFLMVQIAMAVMSALFFFYVDFYFIKSATLNGEASLVGTIAIAILFLMQIFALPLYLKMIEKYGKTFVYRFGSYIWIGAAILLFVLPADGNPIFRYLITALMGFGISAPGLIPHAMYGDVVDVGQLYLEERLDGQMSGFSNFVNQVSQGAGVALVMLIIGFAGFQEQVLGEPKITSQSEASLLAIRLILLLTPAIFLGIGALVSFYYKVDAKRQEKVKAALSDPALREAVLTELEQ